MNESVNLLKVKHIPHKMDSLICDVDKLIELTLEVEIREENQKPKFYIKNINTKDSEYLKIKSKDIIGKNIFDIYEYSSAKLYYEVALRIYNSKTKGSVKFYIKNKNGKSSIIFDKKIAIEEDANYMEITLYPFVEDNEMTKMFVVIKNATKYLKEIQTLKEEEAVKIYNDKITSMSDIISNLSHVWRQPLNSLNFCILNLIDEIKDECKYCIDLEDYYKEMWEIMKSLSKKIDKFQSFFELSDKNEHFEMKRCIDLTFEIMEEKIKKDNIKISINAEEKINMYGCPNEFSQLMYHIFCDMIEWCKEYLDINDRILDVKIYSNNKIINFEIRLIYDKQKYKTIDLNLKNLMIIRNIVEQRMKGTISLMDDNLEKGILLNIPFSIEEV
ncbi:transcriptional regulator [Tepidibacter thalassicus]|uniref:Histidine kinase n=1 Tax=Tepidibacter thalassicus DSM 15285 TaxID=1123350 RepID=A0A1M5RKE5_9FIRM|nr:HAMP domain-containing histidine kinase [Tepidibacter thalassicus]SHH26660.1 hypothetical protein SAMN02744040_01410 [Tepidibacter thalassicus DSM 15285]